MSLEQTIMQDLKTAMKAKDQAALRGVRAIKAAITMAKTDGTGQEIDSAYEIKMLQKLIKQRQESLKIFEDQNREDLAVKEREEIEVIQRYLPEQMSDEELETRIKEIIEQLGATSMKDMGQVMGAANKAFAGKADGKTISAKIKTLLNS